MSVYRQRYEEWFNNLSDVEREAETSRLNSNKSTRKTGAAKVKQEPKQQQQQQQQQLQQQQMQPPMMTINQPQHINLASLVNNHRIITAPHKHLGFVKYVKIYFKGQSTFSYSYGPDQGKAWLSNDPKMDNFTTVVTWF